MGKEQGSEIRCGSIRLKAVDTVEYARERVFYSFVMNVQRKSPPCLH